MACVVLLQAARDAHHRAAGDREIVHDRAVFFLDVADDVQNLCLLTVIKAGLAPDGHVRVQRLGVLVLALCAAAVRRDDDEIFIGKPLPTYGFAEQRHRVQMVDQLFEKALNLRSMQVHEQNAVHADCFDTVRTDTGSDGYVTIRNVLLFAAACCASSGRRECIVRLFGRLGIFGCERCAGLCFVRFGRLIARFISICAT